MENNELKRVCFKSCACYYFDNIIKLEDFDLNNISTNEKLHENLLILTFHIKLDPKLLRIRIDKINRFIRVYAGNRYLNCLGLKNVILFMTELITLKVIKGLKSKKWHNIYFSSLFCKNQS